MNTVLFEKALETPWDICLCFGVTIVGDLDWEVYGDRDIPDEELLRALIILDQTNIEGMYKIPIDNEAKIHAADMHAKSLGFIPVFVGKKTKSDIFPKHFYFTDVYVLCPTEIDALILNGLLVNDGNTGQAKAA